MHILTNTTAGRYKKDTTFLEEGETTAILLRRVELLGVMFDRKQTISNT